ncbi:class I SAM-dependent rRNA methyltransferase [Hymenobacter sp. BT188]|uniref:class I SAM-dependent rRNA methyltransferase n=1 Tax=Hymenobacter sp. BT188 TaxID=2763504 RepID=UPI0016518072|nr:class I SAM-dependent rRNA methyltransferase [Hymenobacter sp. BT188]MBC6608179.1 class I SAM-dependent rRNA methyltransferase [Hymenobacter sp. BT188]
MPAIVILKPGKDQSLRRLHPWVFSGAIARMQGQPQEGEVVIVHASNGEQLGVGHYAPGSIAVRMLGFGPEATEPDAAFWEGKLRNAYQLRQRLGLTTQGNNSSQPTAGKSLQSAKADATDVYRLIHAEGDGLPGLIVDVYGDVAVLQAHSAGMYLARPQIAEALKAVLGDKLRAIYDKSAETVPAKAAPEAKNGYLLGSSTGTEHLVHENAHPFAVDWETGQKTGFFIDQRDNRDLLARYSAGRRVLNTFCYTGGFSVYALQAGATLVHSVDSSKRAIELTERNAALTGLEDKHAAYAQDVFTFMKASEEQYDLIVLDPPAFAKHLSARHNALMGYKRLNAAGLRRIAPGGILFTFSCSQVVSRELFQGAVLAAAIEAGRQVRVLHHLTQPADHPVSLFHPEGEYLKGLVLAVE